MGIAGVRMRFDSIFVVAQLMWCGDYSSSRSLPIRNSLGRLRPSEKGSDAN